VKIILIRAHLRFFQKQPLVLSGGASQISTVQQLARIV